MRALLKFVIFVFVIIACMYAFKLGADMQYERLENEYQMCIER